VSSANVLLFFFRGGGAKLVFRVAVKYPGYELFFQVEEFARPSTVDIPAVSDAGDGEVYHMKISSAEAAFLSKFHVRGQLLESVLCRGCVGASFLPVITHPHPVPIIQAYR
jgi:hypothetical protein